MKNREKQQVQNVRPAQVSAPKQQDSWLTNWTIEIIAIVQYNGRCYNK